MSKIISLLALCLVLFTTAVKAQNETTDTKEKAAAPSEPKKLNQRSGADSSTAEPFDQASVEKMKTQCVKFETAAGVIEMEMFPESSPETVRNFLNLTAIGAFDTTTFSRIVPGFVIQGGNLSTREKMTPEIAIRSRRKVPDEPSLIKHERGILSMARSQEKNSASTSFFILVSEAPHLDGTFAAFGRVTSGMEVVDAINKMAVEGEKPTNPVRITRATIIPCSPQTESK
jgi:peptidyl-prolyl cis-trans isomerase B (cyclophilin B)